MKMYTVVSDDKSAYEDFNPTRHLLGTLEEAQGLAADMNAVQDCVSYYAYELTDDNCHSYSHLEVDKAGFDQLKDLGVFPNVDNWKKQEVSIINENPLTKEVFETSTLPKVHWRFKHFLIELV